MKVEHQGLRATRNLAAFKLMDTVALFQQGKPTANGLTPGKDIKTIEQAKTAIAFYQQSQKEWMKVFATASPAFVNEALMVPLEQFTFAWHHVETPTGIGRHIDAAHAKWGRFGHSAIGSLETEVQTRIYAMVNDGANDWSLARMLQDLGGMPGVLGGQEFGTAITLALAIDGRRKKSESPITEITKPLLPIYDRATVTLRLSKSEAEKVLTKARRAAPP